VRRDVGGAGGAVGGRGRCGDDGGGRWEGLGVGDVGPGRARGGRRHGRGAADLSGGGGWKVAYDADFFGGGFGFWKESGEVGGGGHGQLSCISSLARPNKRGAVVVRGRCRGVATARGRQVDGLVPVKISRSVRDFVVGVRCGLCLSLWCRVQPDLFCLVPLSA
jgi:hypothetical protein